MTGSRNQWALRLACQLIRTYHGEVTEKVCRCLCGRGQSTLAELIRGAGMPAAQVKQALMLAIQHSYVAAYCIKEDEEVRRPNAPTRPHQYVYEAQVDSMLLLLRHPAFLVHVGELHGSTAERLARTLLQNGRLSFDQLVAAMALDMRWSKGEATRRVKGLLHALVACRFVERAPPCTLPPPKFLPHTNAQKSRGKPRAGGEKDQAAALRGLDEMRYDHQRFKLPASLLNISDEVEDDKEEPGGSEPQGDLLLSNEPGAAPQDATTTPGEMQLGVSSPAAGAAPRVKPGVDVDDLDDVAAAGEEEEEEPATRGSGTRGGKAGRGGKQAAGAKRGAAGSADKLPVKRARIKAGTKRVEVATAEGAAAALKVQAAQEAAAASQEQDGARDVLWRVNAEELNRHLRHAALVQLASDKYEQDMARILEAMLAAGRSFETKVNEAVGPQLSIDEIQSWLRRLAAERRQRQQREEETAQAAAAAEGADAAPSGGGEVPVKQEPATDAAADGAAAPWAMQAGAAQESAEERAALDQLCANVQATLESVCGDGLVDMAGNGPTGPQYQVNMQYGIEMLRLAHLEAAARDRFGEGGLRILRMLAIKKQLEQKQVTDECKLEAKETREVLYRMLTAGFVLMQDIPKTSDRAPSRTFYTWSFDFFRTSQRLALELYRAAGNNWVRLQHEQTRVKEVMDLILQSQAVGSLVFTITPAHRQQIARWNKINELLGGCLTQLDESIALFNNWQPVRQRCQGWPPRADSE